MLVFGGVGLGAIFGDVHCLHCEDVYNMTWEELRPIEGNPPSARYGHSMVAVEDKIVLFGGTSQMGYHHIAFNDVHILHVTRGPNHGFSLRWSSLNVSGDIPCPRSRQSMCRLDGHLYVFGGSDEGFVQGAAAADGDAPVVHKVREVDTRLYVLAPSDLAGVDDITTFYTPSGYIWANPPMSIVAFNHEPPVIIKQSQLRVEMQSMLDNPRFCDMAFATAPSLDQDFASLSVSNHHTASPTTTTKPSLMYVHKSILCARSPHFRAMLFSGMKESSSSVIELEDMTEPVLKALLSYIYTVSLPFSFWRSM